MPDTRPAHLRTTTWIGYGYRRHGRTTTHGRRTNRRQLAELCDLPTACESLRGEPAGVLRSSRRTREWALPYLLPRSVRARPGSLALRRSPLILRPADTRSTGLPSPD